MEDVFSILEKRAKERGFINLKEALMFLQKNELAVVYLVVKEYSLIEIVKAIRTVLKKTDKEKINFWYQKCWTKTIILAGNPLKIKDFFPFIYLSPQLGVLGPLLSSEKMARALVMNYTVPLKTSPIEVKRFEEEGDKNFVIVFNDLKLSLGKFITQLVHILAETGIENQILPSKPTIIIGKRFPKDYFYKYERIDGGLSELEPFTHTATAFLLKKT